MPLTKETRLTAIEKALTILDLIGKHFRGGSVRLSSLVEESGFPRPTVYRIVSTLVEYGYVIHDRNTGFYKLGGKLMELAFQAFGMIDLREVSRPHLVALSERLKLTAHLAVYDHREVVYIDKVDSPHPIRIASGIGWRGGLHCTSLGKAMMAVSPGDEIRARALEAGLTKRTQWTITTVDRLDRELARIRNVGYAVDRRENEEEICCVASAIQDFSGNIIGGISVSGTTSQVTRERIPEIGKQVRSACKEISLEYGALHKSSDA